MRLLYLRTVFWFNLVAGGSVGHTSGVINAIKDKVNLMVISNDLLPEVNHPIEVIKPGFCSLLPSMFGELLYSLIIIKNVGKKQFDAIYQRYSGLSFCGAYLADKKGIPFVLEFNSSDVWKLVHWKSSYSRGLIKFFKQFFVMVLKLPIVWIIENYNLKKASLIIVVSQSLKDSLVKSGIQAKKILVNPNGVDVEKFNPRISGAEVKRAYDLEGKIVFGFIGTFGLWHGVELIVAAYGLLIKSNPDMRTKTRLLMVGDGEKMSDVRAIINEMHLSDITVFTGLIDQKDGPLYLAACDVLINATKSNPDGSPFFGSPTKLFEYMAMGKAIICSNIGQMSYILKNEHSALMVEPDNVNQIMLAMKRLFEDEQLRDFLGNNALKEVVRKFTWNKHVEEIIDAMGKDEISNKG